VSKTDADRTISETVSEKRRRGRPSAFEREDDRKSCLLYPDVTTKRSIRSKQYVILGLRAIRPDGVEKINPYHDWFAGLGKGQHRQAVLVELGRIAVQPNNATALDMANKLADRVAAGEFKTTRQAAAWLRWARLSTCNKVPFATALALAKLLITTIMNFMADHPEADADLVNDALANVGER
jgi:hypothetical protein